ncbi:MAG: ion transporter [Alphaproteobacteria bacterium]|nr:ion transporter [Alphaproteobacteria bacterium]
METYPAVMARHGTLLTRIDQTILVVFVIEILIRFVAYRANFFKDPWSLFDLFVVSISLFPAQDAFSALRSARALRALRLISTFPKLRKVIEGLVMAIPGICAIAGVMAVIMCVFGLIASKLYGPYYPEWFGNLHLSIFSLFQIMTLEGWPDIVRTVMAQKPFSWVFFVTYILIATFSVLNLFIAVVVDAMQRNHQEEPDTNLQHQENIEKKLDAIFNAITKK